MRAARISWALCLECVMWLPRSVG